MIQNHEQLKVTQEQIQRIEHALEDLKRSANRTEVSAQAPALVEHIRRMRTEIDEYLGITSESRQ